MFRRPSSRQRLGLRQSSAALGGHSFHQTVTVTGLRAGQNGYFELRERQRTGAVQKLRLHGRTLIVGTFWRCGSSAAFPSDFGFAATDFRSWLAELNLQRSPALATNGLASLSRAAPQRSIRSVTSHPIHASVMETP